VAALNDVQDAMTAKPVRIERPKTREASRSRSIIQALWTGTRKRLTDGSTAIQDPEGAWNVKAGSDGKRKSTYGDKAHINVDEDGLIKEYR